MVRDRPLAARPAAHGRGRRVHLPSEEGAQTPRQRCNARIAWLLVTNRVLGPHSELSRRGPFLDALAARGRSVDASTVSRWEAGVIDVTDHTVALYEDILGLPGGALRAVCSGLRRVLDPDRAPSSRRPPHDPFTEDLEPLIQRIQSGSGTGGDWLKLTTTLSAFGFVRMRRAEWERLCRQLVDELSTSVGLAAVRRHEAAVDLLHRPETGRHLIDAIAEFVTTPDGQALFRALFLLAEIDDESAGTLATRLLDADNPIVRLAAARTSAVKLTRGQDAGMSLTLLEEHIDSGLRAGASVSDRLEFANLAVHVPDASWARIRASIPAEAEVAMVETARAGGDLLLREEVRTVVDDLAASAVSDTQAPGAVGHDPMLRTLLREALLGADSARRQQAMLTICASPYAGALARHGQELGHTEFPVLASRLQELLINSGGADTGGEPLRSALAEGRPVVRAQSLIAMGVRPGGLHADEDAAIVEHTVGSESAMDRAAGLYALGMAGSDSVGALVEHVELGPAARWWDANGPALHDSDVTVD